MRDKVLQPNLEEIYDKINIVKGEVENLELLERILNEYEIDTVFHLAAQTIVGTGNRSPISTFETNIKGTWNILEASRRISTVKAVIVASSDKAYGDQKILPYNENSPLQGAHPYDVSKSCADLIAYTYYKTYGLPVCVTRCGNFYGGGDLNFNRIIPGTIRSIFNNEAPIIRSDGTLIRDYIYIKDGVYAYMLLAEKMRELDIAGEAFNFSNENKFTVKNITEKIIQVMNFDLKPVILNEVKNEILHQYLSANKAKTILNWEPKYTIEEGLKETINWYKKRFSELYGNKL
jgi:CDP-glucose 4,6-dehydratase